MAEISERRFALTRSILTAALAARAFPAAAIEVGNTAGPHWSEAYGRLTYDTDAPQTLTTTLFDLASLTKVVATTSFALRHVAAGRLAIDAAVADYNPLWRDALHRSITIRHLLEHASGLPAHVRLWESHRGRDEFAGAIHDTTLDGPAGAHSVYSDLGFITLGFLIEDIGGSLDAHMNALASDLALTSLRYGVADKANVEGIAPTEFDVWRNRVLVGEVHDENAAALGGVAAHAGLFGSVEDVGTFARVVLETFQRDTRLGPRALMNTFATRSIVPGSSRALGWDTMLPTSSCGTRLSPAAIGHTGFTGTSLWIDPAQDLYVVLLTNRVHPSRANEALRPIRPRVHDAVIEDLR